VTSWGDVVAAEPELAAFVADRLRAAPSYLATVRANELLDRVLAYIDEPFLADYPMHPLPRHIRVALAARKTGAITNREAVMTPDGEAFRITWYTMPNEPAVKVDAFRGGAAIAIEYQTRPIEYYGEVFVIEHTVHVDGGEAVELVAGPERYAVTPPT
jgi:hypothetical protein